MNPAQFEQQLTGVYRERAYLVAMLARMYPSVFWRDDDELDFPVVYIDTPVGQLSWHISSADMDLFDGTPWVDECPWDGHTVSEKYERLRHLPTNYIFIMPDTVADFRNTIAAGGLSSTIVIHPAAGYDPSKLQKWALNQVKPDTLS